MLLATSALTTMPVSFESTPRKKRREAHAPKKMTLIQHLNGMKNRIGLVGGLLKINEYEDAEENITTCIDPKTWNIEINLKQGFDPIKDRRQKAYARAKKIKDSKKVLLEDVLTHELAHWELPFGSGRGCPFDEYNHDLILESVKKNLPEKKQSMAGYVANMLENMIINPRAKEYKGSFSGQVLFFDEQGIKLNKPYTPIYEAFVKLNMHLWGDNLDNALVKRHYGNDKKADKAVAEVISHLSLPANIQDTRQLFNRERWPDMAAKFARAIEPLVDEQPEERLSAGDQGKGSGDGKKDKPGNGVEQQAKSKDGLEKIARGRYANGKKLSPNITNYEQLDALYRSLAKGIPVQVEAMTRQDSLELCSLNHRAFDEEADDLQKIKLSKLMLGDEGMAFAYPKDKLVIPVRMKVQRKSFPDFKIIMLDNSGSMKEGINGNAGNKSYIPWGDKSKYHFALLGLYGIEQFLQKQGISQYINHGLSLFSNSQRYKETSYSEIDKLRRLALSPEFGNTYIDAGELMKSLKGRESFALSISDGEIMNWDSEKQDFEKLAKNNHYAHIQIGNSNRFTADLEKMDLPVFYVDSGEKLSRLMVDTALKTYKSFVRNGQNGI